MNIDIPVPFRPTRAALAPRCKTYETSCSCQVSPPLCVQLTPPILIAGESAAASAVEENHEGVVVDDGVLWNRDCCCCCRILLLGVPLLVVVELVEVEIAERSTAGLTLKADVVVMGRLP
jgi:chloramphenicol 3-O-phosphotransferase